jgi:hypothetical protein
MDKIKKTSRDGNKRIMNCQYKNTTGCNNGFILKIEHH